MTTSTSVKAPEGQVWYCPMCGKSSPTHDGLEDNKFVGEKGWDVSCFIHSYLVNEVDLKAHREQMQREFVLRYKEYHGN
jgi:hypothetical protein